MMDGDENNDIILPMNVSSGWGLGSGVHAVGSMRSGPVNTSFVMGNIWSTTHKNI